MNIEEARQRPTITVPQAAKILGIHPTAAYDAVHRGDIPSFRIGRKILVPTATLLRQLGYEVEPVAVGAVSDEDRDAS